MSSEVIEAFDFRAVVEPPIAGMAALRATKADVIRLKEACARMDHEQSARAFAELDRAFHYRIAEACHNRLLSALIDLTGQWIATTRVSTLQTRRRREASRSAHWRIYEAISSGDAEAAAAAMADHIAEVAQLLKERPARRGA
jgi:GntR family transcriptional repressor for pyruvate dehydrogenase complex